MSEATPQEIAEARRANLLQRHADGKRLSAGEREEIADLITEAAPEKSAGGRPTSAIRWTMGLAAKEFGIDAKTLSGRLRRESIEPGEDGHYATTQICQALFGDNEERSRIKLNDKRSELAQLQIDAERKERVRIDYALELHDKAMSEIVMILRGLRGRIVDEVSTADMLDAFRKIPDKLRSA